MPSYTLSVNLTEEQVKLFYLAGSNVVIAKPTEGGESNVAWQVFRPLEKNKVEWEEQYGIYASTVEIQNGARLTQMSQTPIPSLDGKIYPFLVPGVFGPPEGNEEKGTYYSINEYELKSHLTFGLYQGATVNGELVPGNAISAATVLQGNAVEMTPFTTLYVWLQSQVVSNTVVTKVTSPKTKVVFGGATNEISLTYDNHGHFVEEGKGELPRGASVKTYVPLVY